MHGETTEAPIWTFTTAAVPPSAPINNGLKTRRIGEKIIFGFATIDPNNYDVY